MQEWHCKNDNAHLKRLAQWVPKLKAIGLDNIWVPPCCKASSPEGNGYDIYDLWDLGVRASLLNVQRLWYIHQSRCFATYLQEFDQKGSVATKWGTKEDLTNLIKVGKEHGVGIM